MHVAAGILLHDGRVHEAAFELMQIEGAFRRLVELIRDRQDDVSGIHRLLLELLFEMSRVQKLTREDLCKCRRSCYLLRFVLISTVTVDDTFILYLLQLVEQLSGDADDPYHYPIIRVLVWIPTSPLCYCNMTLTDASLF